MVVVVVALTAMWFAQQRGLIGPSNPSWVVSEPIDTAVAAGARPTPAHATSDAPLGEPIVPPPGGGPFEFLQTQQDSTDPVAYDPCRQIPVVVNSRTAPPVGDVLLDDALASISEVTGLIFVLEGATDEQTSEGRAAFQPDRYGDRWAPVLISWSDASEIPSFATDVVGVGGSTAAQVPGGGPLVYVSGLVALDGPAFAEILEREDGYHIARAIILHELGHLLGLGHVEGSDQIMAERGGGVLDFQSGDLTGLARLGRGACVPEL